MGRILRMAASAAVLGSLALAHPAGAVPTLYYSTNGGASYAGTLPLTPVVGLDGTTSYHFTGFIPTTTVGLQDFTINSNAPNTGGTLADLFEVTSYVINNSSTTYSGSTGLALLVSDSPFTSPTAPPTAKLFTTETLTGQSNGGQPIVGGSVLGVQGCANSPPGAEPQLATSCTYSTTATSLQTVDGTTQSMNSANAPVATLASPFELTTYLYLSTVMPLTKYTFTTSTKLESTTPEPISLSLLGVGLIGLGATRLRRRKA